MSEISDKIHEKCLAFSDRIIKLNDYLQKEAANAKPLSFLNDDIFEGHFTKSIYLSNSKRKP